jgi:DNA-binding response OmpR family regulator
VSHSILIVEDNIILLKGMMALLRPHGHALLGAATVAEARAHLAEVEPSHAILDLNLPDGTGVDVLGEIRSRGCHTVVIIVSGWHDGELVDRARSLGVDGVLLKPPNWDDIVRWAAATPGEGCQPGIS